MKVAISDIISWKWFFLAFFIGLLLVFLLAPEKKVIYKFPSPDNVGIIVYSNEDGTCYKYDAERVKCRDFDKDDIMDQPIIE